MSWCWMGTTQAPLQLRLDAAAMVVGSSWSWAYLQSGLEHDVPEFMIADESGTSPSICTTSEPLDAWHRGGLAPTGSMVPGIVCHNVRTEDHRHLLKTSCSIGAMNDSNSQL